MRDDLPVIGTPKLFVWKHGVSWVKLSLWPFCDLQRQFGRILTSKEHNRCNILPVELDGSTLIKNTGNRHYVFPRRSFRTGIGKLQVCKHNTNWMVIAQSADSFIENFCSARKGKGLKFALNVKFWIENCFPLKKKSRQRFVFFVGFECSRKATFSDLLQNK